MGIRLDDRSQQSWLPSIHVLIDDVWHEVDDCTPLRTKCGATIDRRVKVYGTVRRSDKVLCETCVLTSLRRLVMRLNAWVAWRKQRPTFGTPTFDSDYALWRILRP